VVFQNAPPILLFEPTLSLPRYLETDLSSSSNDVGGPNRGFLHGGYVSYKGDGDLPTTTAHFVRLLKFARNWEETLSRSLSSERRCLLTTFRPNLDHLCSQVVWILIMTIVVYSWMGVNIESLGKQLDEIENLLQIQDTQTTHWISSEEWNQTREWVSKMINRIMGPHRSNLSWSYDKIEIEEPFDNMSNPTKQRRFVPLSILSLTFSSANGPAGYGSLRGGVSFLDI
jgi:hypothetical protein